MYFQSTIEISLSIVLKKQELTGTQNTNCSETHWEACMITRNFSRAAVSKSKAISYNFAIKGMFNILGLFFLSGDITIFVSCNQGGTKLNTAQQSLYIGFNKWNLDLVCLRGWQNFSCVYHVYRSCSTGSLMEFVFNSEHVSNDILIILSLENNLIPKFTFCNAIMTL